MSPPELEKFICQRENKASVFTSNKKAITGIGAELDRHLRSPLFSKPFFSRGYAKHRNDYLLGDRLCKCVTHSDVNFWPRT